ncbi:vitamin K epoxide reductase complex subunit [Nesidiocoris tenuis]|uniref:vitamin-K-epoxide reductase (warfarin-sensitive) n=1 Tax=Nesidiocoris tenuis TaxID=355587 RepID=A0ABN7B3Q9_9HEMI|nr:vitamin K epoxide reductase complex subunit [Nesidiocoris tenuis]
MMSTLHNLPTLNLLIRFSTLMGFVLSLYTYIVELNLHHNHDYVALCDISEHMSCSKAFTSQWGTGFGFVGQLLGEDSVFNQPNSVPGMVFYVIAFILSFPDQAVFAKILLFQSVLANFMSVYLAYILYFLLRDFCIVCISTYVTNATLLYLAYHKRRLLKIENDSAEQKKTF